MSCVPVFIPVFIDGDGNVDLDDLDLAFAQYGLAGLLLNVA